MNFNQQMQEKADLYSHRFNYFEISGSDICATFTSGSRAALSSDLVKGLVEALEDAKTRMNRARNILKSSGEWNMLDTEKAATALTNYKQEINTEKC